MKAGFVFGLFLFGTREPQESREGAVLLYHVYLSYRQIAFIEEADN